MNKTTERLWYDDIMDMCPILYCQRNSSMTETCMCWGFECHKGWSEPLHKMSCRLEELNLRFYDKYHYRIQMDQVKEKYGTLRAYWSLEYDGPWYKRIPRNIASYIYHKLLATDFKMKMIVDKDAWIENKVEEFKTKDEFNAEADRCKNIRNVIFEEKDGRLLKTTALEHCRQVHYEPTKHKVRHKFMRFFKWMTGMLSSYSDDVSNEHKVIASYMQSQADTIVRETEHECYDHCELCGTCIGTSYSPRVETKGWIRYICKDCADEHKWQYSEVN